MENRERALPDWLNNLGDAKSSDKNRQVTKSKDNSSSKRTIGNGTSAATKLPCESIPTSFRSDVSDGSCGGISYESTRCNARDSEDETIQKTSIDSCIESPYHGVMENEVLNHSKDMDCEPLSPSLFEHVTTDIGSSSASDPSVPPSNSSSANITSSPARRNCKYGDKCFRRNPQHLQDFAHPGDVDFSTDDDRPECEYGLSCYRKNPLHRQHYKHTKKLNKPRKAKNPKHTSNYNSTSESDDDDDPFSNSSSDDYEPERSDSDTDFSDTVCSEDDAVQLHKEVKKIKR